MNKSLVTLILLSYNHSAYVDDSLQAVLDQNYENIEIIYIDDASRDDTYEKALAYKEHLERKYINVVMLKNDVNQGIVKNLNRCLGLSHGKYIKILATDDFLFSDSIDVMVEVLENNDSIDVIYSDIVSVNEKDRYVDYKNKKCRHDGFIIPTELDTKPFIRIYNKDDISAPALMMRKSLLKKIGNYDEAIMTEDWDFLLRASVVTDFIHIREQLVAYRYVEDSFSHSVSPSKRIMMKKSELQIIEKHIEVAINNGMDAMSKQRKAFNEAFADAFYIKNKEYIGFLREYSNRNHIRYDLKNMIKNILLYLPYREK